MIEIRAVGGYSEIGRNMTAVNVDGEVIIFDIGLQMENYVRLTESIEDISLVPLKQLINEKAIPDIEIIDDWIDNVKAITVSHAHLDHFGAVPFVEGKFKAPILCSHFTASVLRMIVTDAHMKLKNEIIEMDYNKIFRISDNLSLEFIYVTHSTLQTSLIALHTKYGIILYCNDFKFDDNPTLGDKPDYKRIKELAKKGIKFMIADSLYAWDKRKMPSESEAKDMLKKVLFENTTKSNGILITTFGSHISRLRAIAEFGRKLGRKVVFCGRSIAKYIEAAQECGLIDFKNIEIVKYGVKIAKRLRQIEKEGKEKYLLVVTGHQGEKNSVLSKMADGRIKFVLKDDDVVIFSCNVIPTPTNVANRAFLEKRLKEFGVKMFKDIHVSGHVAREDTRFLIELAKPEHIIPCHADKSRTIDLAELAYEMGYKEEFVHLMENGEEVRV